MRSAAGVGVHLGPQLSVGATFGAVYNSNTLQAPYIFQSHPFLAGTVGGFKTLLDLNTDGIGWNASVGAIMRPSNAVQIGVSWKSRTVIESNGTAIGDAGAQFLALGILPGEIQTDFQYDAMVRNVLPQSLLANVIWQPNSVWILGFQTGWVNWENSFTALPVTLTNGTNNDINDALGSSGITDIVPLNWSDQFSFRAGVERVLGENFSWSGGFAHANNPVPASTLTPMTAAIMSNQLSTGFAYSTGPYRFDVAYSLGLTAESNVGTSSLLSGEYNNSQVSMGTQGLTFGTSIRF
jgi:long-subunit fatty acid transport protein